MFKLFLKILIEKIWYSKNFISFLLLPLSWIYIFFVELRLKLYQFGIFPINKSYAPTIIVGNMVAGGTGKTPLCIEIYSILKNLDLHFICLQHASFSKEHYFRQSKAVCSLILDSLRL